MILPIKYKLHNDRLWVRWGLKEEWKVARITKANKVTPITQSFGNDFKWTKSTPANWTGKWFYREIIGIPGHNGIDFESPSGTRLYAPHDGIISRLHNTDGLGITLKGEEYTSKFLHLQEFHCSLDQEVKKGDFIALCDNTGRYTTAPHLHWGVRGLDGKYIDHRGFIEDLDIEKLPYEEGQCLIRYKANGEFYVVENGDMVYYDSDKQPNRHIPIVDYFLKQKKKGLPPGFIKEISEEEFNKFNK